MWYHRLWRQSRRRASQVCQRQLPRHQTCRIEQLEKPPLSSEWQLQLQMQSREHAAQQTRHREHARSRSPSAIGEGSAVERQAAPIAPARYGLRASAAEWRRGAVCTTAAPGTPVGSEHAPANFPFPFNQVQRSSTTSSNHYVNSSELQAEL